jgi:hypothetical protein
MIPLPFSIARPPVALIEINWGGMKPHLDRA